MVKGKPQAKTAPSKRVNSVSQTKQDVTAVTSPSVSAISTRKSRASTAIALCCGCEKVISEDVKALQCDRCLGDEWKCIDCLCLSVDVYDQLVSDPKCGLRWFCDSCDKKVMNTSDKMASQSSDSHLHNIEKQYGQTADRIDKLVSVVEKLVDKCGDVEDKLRDKVDYSMMAHLDTRIKRLEDQFYKHENNLESKFAAADASISRIVTDKLREFEESRCNKRDDAVVEQAVRDETAKKIEEDKDIESRRNNIIIYKVPELLTDTVDVRKDRDSTYLFELLESVFQMEITAENINKMFRLGRPVEGSDTPRPLLVSFKNLEDKETIMSNLKNLRQADARFKGISVSHDLTPKQREEVKTLIADAKKEHDESSTESSENFRFLVVGKGTRKRVIKIRKEQ